MCFVLLRFAFLFTVVCVCISQYFICVRTCVQLSALGNLGSGVLESAQNIAFSAKSFGDIQATLDNLPMLNGGLDIDLYVCLHYI